MVCSYHFNWSGNMEFSAPMTALVGIKRLLFGINSACCPLFFMVNGALLLPSPLHHNPNGIVRKILRILIQWYIWRIITIVLIRLFYGIDLFPNGVHSFLSLLLGEREGVELNHLWFVSTLVAIYVVFPILHREFQAFLAEGAKDTYFCTFVMLLLLLYFVPIAGNTFFITPLFPQGIALNLSDISSQFLFCGYIGPMLFYFMLGGILHAYRKKLLKIPDYILVIGLMIGLVSLYGRWFLESAVLGSTWDNIYGAYCSFPCLLISVSLFLLFARISFDKVSMPLQKQLKIIGSNTLGVYYMHWIFGCTLLPSIHSVIGHDGLILNFIKALCIVLVFSYVSYFAKKVPFIKNMF